MPATRAHRISARQRSARDPDTHAWQEERLGDLMHRPATSPEPAVLEILDAHGWGLAGST